MKHRYPLAESTGAAGIEAQGMRGTHEYMPALVLLPSFANCSWPLLRAGKKGWIDLACDLIALQIARFKLILVKRPAWQITWVSVLRLALESDV